MSKAEPSTFGSLEDPDSAYDMHPSINKYLPFLIEADVVACN